MSLSGYFGKLGTQDKSVVELNFRESIDCDEENKGLQLQVETLKSRK